MHLLLDADIVLDICATREPFVQSSAAALAYAEERGVRLWLYAGSVQTLEYRLIDELSRRYAAEAAEPTAALALRARQLLKTFSEGKRWLAALADEGPVFDSPDPEREQLVRAMRRFTAGSVRLLTRDEGFCARHPALAFTPEQFLSEPIEPKPLDFVDLDAQQNHLRPVLERNLHAVLHHGHYILGPEVQELEGRLQGYTGAKHCITVASGTEALLISLMALGIKPGDEVITTPFTFVATAEVIVLLGAKPVFVDIDPDTCNIDAGLVEAAITPRTRAIIPVSLYGQPCDMDEINVIAARNGGIPVIEDAAQSFGATYKGRKSCNLSTIGCTSFFPSKPLGCYGDGGAIFTNDDVIAQVCREIRVHGQSKRYVHTLVGVGGRMDTLQCAIVLAKLERFDQEMAQRQAVARRYHDLLGSPEFWTESRHHRGESSPIRVVPWPAEDRTSVFAQYTILADDRDALQERLNADGIPTAIHYPLPLNEQPAYAHLCCPDCTPVAQKTAKRVLSLPMHPDLTQETQGHIVTALSALCEDSHKHLSEREDETAAHQQI